MSRNLGGREVSFEAKRTIDRRVVSFRSGIADFFVRFIAGPPIGLGLDEFKKEMLKRALALSQDSERRLGLSQKSGWVAVWIR